MKIIDVQQGSPEWLAWRKTVITATDCPAILGSSPWSTPYKCWQKKLGLIEEEKSNEAMERGKRLEPIARERFIRRYGINMTPMVVESSECDFLGASLDGISDGGRFILEVKSGGDKLLDMARRDEIPEYYQHQIQKQLLVTEAEKCFYKVTHEEEAKEIVLEVFPDPTFKALYMPKARAFWKCVAFGEPPELQGSDYTDRSHDIVWTSLAVQFLNRREKIKALEELNELDRKELIKLSAGKNCMGGGVKVRGTPRRGQIDYKAIPELQGLDLEQYRREGTTVWGVFAD